MLQLEENGKAAHNKLAVRLGLRGAGVVVCGVAGCGGAGNGTRIAALGCQHLLGLQKGQVAHVASRTFPR